MEQFALVAEGLHGAHQLGLIHRDVKPSNLLTDSGGRYVLVDFGLVHEVEAQTLTRSGELIGTLGYMSPEQVSRSQVDARADVYSLGATLYEVLTLRAPFERGTDHETQKAILFEEPVPPRKLNSRLNRDIETVILKTMEKVPEKRYASAGELAADLRRFLRYEPIRARPLTALTRLGRRVWRRRAAAAATAAIAILLICLGSVLLLNRYQTRQMRIAEYETQVPREVLKLQLGSLLRPSGSERSELDPAGLVSRRDINALAASSSLDPVEDAVRGLARAEAGVSERPEAYYHRARGLDLLGRDEEALAEAARALERDAGFVPAMVLRAALLEKLGNHGEALAGRERAKKLGKEGWAEDWLSAHEARSAERWEEAAEAFGKLIELEGEGKPTYLGSDIEGRLGRASALIEARKFDEAIIDLKVARGLWRRATEPDLLLGKTYYLMGNEAGAEAAFVELWKRAQNRDEAALMIAAMYRGLLRSDKGLDWVKKVGQEGLQARNLSLFLGTVGRWKEAAEAAERACRIDPQDARAFANLGLALLNRRRIIAAEEAVRRAIQIDPEEPSPHDILGTILERRGKLEEAQSELDKALKKDPNSIQALLHMGVVLERQGKLEEAERSYRKVLHLDRGPGRKFAIFFLRDLCHRRGNSQELIESFKEAIQRNPQDALAWSDLACLFHGKARDLADFEETARKAAALDPRNIFALNQLYLLLAFEGKPKEALDALKKTAELGSNGPILWSNLGGAYQSVGKVEEAIAAYRRSMSIDPSGSATFSAQADLCGILRLQGKLREEIRSLRDALARDPGDPLIASQLGIALETEGSHQDAIESFLLATKLDPTFALAHLHLGNCYAEIKKPADAEASYRRAAALCVIGQMGAQTQTALGAFYESQGKIDLAIELYRKALNSTPNPYAVPIMSLSHLLRNQGNLREALALYAIDIRWNPLGAEIGFDANLWSILRNEKDLPGAGRELDGVLTLLETAESWKPESLDSVGRILKTLALLWIHHPERKDPEKALRYAERALREGRQGDPEAYLVLAEVHKLSGRPADAVLALEEGMRLDGATRTFTGMLEEYRKAVLPDLPSCESIDASVAGLDLEVLVADGAEWSFFRGKKEPSPGLEWTEPGFAATRENGWEVGQSGFGYGDNDDRTVFKDMKGTYTTVYLRRKFHAADPGALRGLILSVRVDDGFVAYLNGKEVGRVRAPGESGTKVLFDGVASEAVSDAEEVEVSIDPKLLETSENLLAIQGLNNGKASSDMSLIPVLKAERPPDPARHGKIIEDFRKVAKGADAPSRLAYLEGRLLQRVGKEREAGERFAAAVGQEKTRPDAVLRLAKSLRSSGRSAEARGRLAETLRGPQKGEKRLWQLYLAVSFVDLKLSPRELLAELPKDGTPGYTEDLRWLLERLKGGQPVCIDCGTREDPASAGAWGRDRFFEGGYRHGESAGAPDWRFIGGIAATEEDPIYRTARDFPQNELRSPAYRVPLPPGNYTVTLHFAELWHVKPGGRVFDVLIEGRKVLDGYDAAAKVGYAAADRQPFHNVAVSDGILDIEFQARADNPSVAAIEIDTER